MKRLSDVIKLQSCGGCGVVGTLHTVYVRIGTNNYEVTTKCKDCGDQDLLRINKGELGKTEDNTEAVG